METPFVRSIPRARARSHTIRVQLVSSLGPTVAAAGVIWTILQPERVTLLHPRGQGFWWLVAEPPLYLVIVGVLFALFVARPLIADLEAAVATSR